MEGTTTRGDAQTALRRALEDRRSCVLYGPPGVGKTHAIQQLLPRDAVRVELGLGDVVDDLVIGIASRLQGTEHALDALRAEDVRGALDALERPLNGFPLVIDRAERLTTTLPAMARDTIAALAQDRALHVMEWLGERAQRHSIIAVSRGRSVPPKAWQRDDVQPIPFTRPRIDDLGRGPHIARQRWAQLAEELDHNPAALLLMGLSLRLLGGSSDQIPDAALDDLLERVRDLPPGGALTWTAAEWLPRLAGEQLGAALAIAARLPGAPTDVLTAAFEAVDIPAETIRTLTEAGVLEARRDERWVLRAIEDAKDAYPLHAKDAERALRAAAQRYLAHVPNRARPTPTSARSLLEAHRLFLEIGDEEEARRTAAFHVGGLIELARRLSREKRAYHEAAALYADVERMLNDRARSQDTDLMEASPGRGVRDVNRLRSYVVHYKHYNRDLGGLEDSNDVLQGFRRARELWPENALWYAHEVAVLFKQGREMDALRLRDDAYDKVKQHPQRHQLLTGRPAEAAWQANRPITALKLLLSLGLRSRTDLTLEPAWSLVLGGWSRGVNLAELPGHGRTRVVFSTPPRATLKEAGDVWLFEIMTPLDVFTRSTSPDEAIYEAGDKLAAEVRRLVQAYADELTKEELERKVLLLRYVDLLAGDIGLAFSKERWLLGRIEGTRFIPVQYDFEPLEIPAVCRPSSEPDKLWFAKVATYRDGRPMGEVLACEPYIGRPQSAERS